MGEAYRAREPRLHRDVAIKVFAAHRSELFEWETKVITTPNGPDRGEE
jgi:hypothetical protein